MAEGEGHGDTPLGVDIPFPKETPQDRGRRYEKKRAKDQGMRLHPGSGAGSIKHDASDDHTLMEYKTATRSFSLSGKYILGLFKLAVRQDKVPVLEIDFPEHKVRATVTFRRTE